MKEIYSYSSTKIDLMKKCFTLITVMLFTVASWAQNADYLLKKDFQTEKKKISEGIDAAKKTGYDAKRIAEKQTTAFDSLAKLLSANEKELKQTNDSLQKTTARFNDLDIRVTKTSNNAENYLLLAVIVIALIFLLILALIFYLRSKTDEKINELREENIRLDESVKQDLAAIREDLKKSVDSLSSTLHEYSAKFNASIERCEEKQRTSAAELEASVSKVAKDHTLHVSKVDEKFNDLSAKMNADRADHKTFHDKIESDLKALRSLQKVVEEIKAKL
jgi:hypothetical protein